MRERRRSLLEPVRTRVRDIHPLPNGYRYTFENGTEIIAAIEQLVELERQCCAFLKFELTRDSDRSIDLFGA